MSTQLNKSSRKAPSRLLNTTRKGMLFLAVAAGLSASSAFAVGPTTFFDWTNGTAAGPGYTPVLNLDGTSAASVATYLTANPSQVIAVKINSDVTLNFTDPNVLAVFNNANVKYVFADYEGTNNTAQTTTLVTNLQTATTFGTRMSSGSAFVGNYALSPIPGADPTAPSGSPTVTTGNGSGSSTLGPTPYTSSTQFNSSGVNMGNEQLYPGDSSFRNPINANSTAPNIRSALFTLPVQRLTLAVQNTGANQLNIPYISRFNNFDNPYLSNTTVARTDNVGTQNAFDASGAHGTTLYGQPVVNQLLSRGDFTALTLHYRMRGASGYQLLDSGVQGYSQTAFEQDAQAGWNNSLVSSVMGGVNGRVGTAPTTVTVNGVRETIEQAGVVWSAVTNDGAIGGGSPELAVLVSNLSDTTATNIALNSTAINGAKISGSNATVTLSAGTHILLRFTKSGTVWTYQNSAPVFDTTNVALTARDGIGIPEPTSLSLLGLGALGILSRRRRKA